MPNVDWKQVAENLNTHLAREHLSSADVARRAGVDRKTVDRLRAGRAVRPHTLEWIEQALRVTLLSGQDARGPDVAPAACGAYHKHTVLPYTGTYTGYRRSFDNPGYLIATRMELFWDDDACMLRFNEDQQNRDDSGRAYQYHFTGDVMIPPNLGVLHLVVKSGDGRIRLISTSMPREDQGTLVMKGYILTLNEITDIGFYPATSPIFLCRETPGSTTTTGVIHQGHQRYEWASAILRDVERKFSPRRA